jgi:hypothetical protein
MRYIDIQSIDDVIKRIPWNEKLKKKYKHLDILVKDNVVNWYEVEEYHKNNLKGKTKEEISAYFKIHSDWNILKKILKAKCGKKCWYSEAPLDNIVIDHFRPKNISRNFCLDINDHNHKKTLKTKGYYWLAYDIDNLILSSNISNIRTDDMSIEESQVGGKSYYFPLKFENNDFVIADDESCVLGEKHILLKPTKDTDPDLITFDEAGEPLPCGISEYQNYRANVSIELYNLKFTDFVDGRQKNWFLVKNMIEKTKKFLDNTQIDEERKQDKQDECNKYLRNALDNKSFFSSVAYACYKSYSIKKGYEFLNSFKP